MEWERAAWWLGLTVKLSKARQARRALSVSRLGLHALPPARRSLKRCSAPGRGCAGQRARSGWRYKVDEAGRLPSQQVHLSKRHGPPLVPFRVPPPPA